MKLSATTGATTLLMGKRLLSSSGALMGREEVVGEEIPGVNEKGVVSRQDPAVVVRLIGGVFLWEDLELQFVTL